MATSTAAAANAPTEKETNRTEEPRAGVSMLDIDFLVFALPLAVLLDALSYILLGFDGGIIAAVVNILLGGLLVLWMMWRGKRMDEAKQQYQEAVQNARQSKEDRQKKRAFRRAKTRAKVGKRAFKRLSRRALIMFVGNSIPIVNFIPFWLIGVIMMLREK